MLSIKEIRENLYGHGDIKEIARITGYNVSYVRKVLSGERNNALIIHASKELAKRRLDISTRFMNLSSLIHEKNFTAEKLFDNPYQLGESDKIEKIGNFAINSFKKVQHNLQKVIKSKTNSISEYKSDLGNINSDIFVYIELLNDCLSAYHYQQNIGIRIVESVELKSIFNDLSPQLNDHLARKNISIHHEFANNLTSKLNVNLAKVLCRNLVLQAVHSSIPGGLVHVKAFVSSKKTLIIQVDDNSTFNNENWESSKINESLDKDYENLPREYIYLDLCEALCWLAGGLFSIGLNENQGKRIRVVLSN